MSDNSPVERPVDPGAFQPLLPPPPAPVAPTYGPPGPGQFAASTYGASPYRVAPKSPGLALLASFFIPGLGSMMNGDAGKGIGILLGYIVSWFLVIIFIGFIGIFGFWVWGLVDAYQGARKWNAAHGIIS